MASTVALATAAAGTSTSLQKILRDSTPGFGFMQSFFKTWLKLDLTTLAAVMTIFGTISSASVALKGLGTKVYWWFTALFTASISVASSDRLNREILNWVGAQVLTRQATRILTARTEVVQNDSWIPRRSHVERNDYDHEKRVPIQYLPTFGMTWFIFERNIFLVRRINTHRSYVIGVPDEYAAAPEGDEPLVVMCLGRSVEPIKRFLTACRDFAEKQREKYITVRASKQQYQRDSWDVTILRPIRPLETVHFDETTKAELVADIQNYLDPNTRKFYAARGIPYRRGYLLHGTPGTGKTSVFSLFSLHQWVSEFATQSWFSMYYGSRDIQSLIAIFFFFKCSLI
jgi:chaperone BCS1